MAEYKSHKLAKIFPLLTGDGLKELAEDIREHGLHEPITLHEGEIVDGRNRYKACLKAGVKPEFRQWDKQGSLLDFIISMNLKRRHLNESQRAEIAGRIANLPSGWQKNRPRGRLSDSTDNKTTPTQAAQKQAAKLMNVGERSVRRGKRVLKHGTPEMIKQVQSGDMTLAEAERRLPKAARKGKREVTVRDRKGYALPGPIAERFVDARQTLKDFHADLLKIRKRFQEMRTTKPAMFWPDKTATATALQDVLNACSAAMPYTICPYCSGRFQENCQGCAECNFLGWVPRTVWDAAGKGLHKQIHKLMVEHGMAK